MKYLRTIICLLIVAFLSHGAWADQSLINQALGAFNKKDYKTANRLIDQHLANNPKDDQAQYAKAMILNKMGFYAKALKRLEIVMKLSPKNHLAVQAYGAIVQQEVYRLINASKIDDALRVAQYGITVVPKDPGSYFAKGVALFERWCQNENSNDHQEALEAWKQARDLQPVSATAELLAGIYAFDGYDYNRAKEHFKTAKAMRPNNRYAAMWLGLAYAALGENNAALAELKNVMVLFSQNPSLHLYMGDIYKVDGKYAEAKKEYETALALKPKDPKVMVALKELYLASGDINGGINYYVEAITQDPSSFEERFRLSNFLQQAGRNEEALVEYGKCLEIPDITPEQRTSVNLQRAIIFLENGDKNNAAVAFTAEDDVVAKAMKNPQYLIYKSYVDQQLDQREAALRKALTYSGIDSTWLHSAAFKSWAELELSRKQYVRAMEMIYQAWRRTPATSATAQDLQKLFDNAKSALAQSNAKEIKDLENSREKDSDPFKYSEKLKDLKDKAEVISSLSMGTAGSMLTEAPGMSSQKQSLIPASLDANLPHLVTTVVAPSSWMHVAPSWQQD